jgi:hypothetical protein
MIFFVLIIACLYLFFKLVTSGLLFKWLFTLFGWLGMYWFLAKYVPSSDRFGIIILDYCMTWSIVLPTIVVIGAFIFIKD